MLFKSLYDTTAKKKRRACIGSAWLRSYETHALKKIIESMCHWQAASSVLLPH
jgi:hypothetical protein